MVRDFLTGNQMVLEDLWTEIFMVMSKNDNHSEIDQELVLMLAEEASLAQEEWEEVLVSEDQDLEEEEMHFILQSETETHFF